MGRGILLSYANATNLTRFEIDKQDVSNSAIRDAIASTCELITGSINIFNNHIKLRSFSGLGLKNITGDFSMMIVNMNKLGYFDLGYDYGYVNNYSTLIYGSINAFSDKYNMTLIRVYRYPNITGEVKNLKNLKKLYCLWLTGTQVTGFKADLYNNGANIIVFYI